MHKCLGCGARYVYTHEVALYDMDWEYRSKLYEGGGGGVLQKGRAVGNGRGAIEQHTTILCAPLQAYPSMKPLGAWTRDLVHRVEQFSKWAETTHPPVLFWLSGFTFPTGFLTAVLQNAARRNNVGYCSWKLLLMLHSFRSQ